MKKLITLSTALFMLIIGAASISAQPSRGRGAKAKPVKKSNARFVKRNRNSNNKSMAGLYNGYYNRRGVYIYTTTNIVSKWNGKFKNTYQHKVFPNGRHNIRLIKSVRLPHIYPVNVRYQSNISRLGGHNYRIVYKITRFSNGYIQKIVHTKHRVW